MSVVLEATEACVEVVVVPVAANGCGAVAALRDVLDPPTTTGPREPGIKLAPRMSELFRTGGTLDVEGVRLATLGAPLVSAMMEATEACAAVLVTVAAESACGSVATPGGVLAPSIVAGLRDGDSILGPCVKKSFRATGRVDSDSVSSVESVTPVG